MNQALGHDPLAHNARPFRDGVLFNDTGGGLRSVRNADHGTRVSVPLSPRAALRTSIRTISVARQAFDAGLCVIDDDRLRPAPRLRH
jgi:hypothetical protein